MSRFWLHFEPFYKLTKFYKMEMEGRKKGSLKFTDEILKKARQHSELISSSNDSPKNSIKTLVNPKYGLSDEEIREEINSLIMAVS